MNKEEAIKYLQQLYPNGGHCWLDEQRIEAIGIAVKALQEEPQVKESVKTQHENETCKENANSLTQDVSEELEQAAIEYCGGSKGADARVRAGFVMGAQWQKEQFEKKAGKGVHLLRLSLSATPGAYN